MVGVTSTIFQLALLLVPFVELLFQLRRFSQLLFQLRQFAGRPFYFDRLDNSFVAQADSTIVRTIITAKTMYDDEAFRIFFSLLKDRVLFKTVLHQSRSE